MWIEPEEPAGEASSGAMDALRSAANVTGNNLALVFLWTANVPLRNA